MTERLAIVVPAYNEENVTSTLSALFNQNYKDIDGVHHYIVDNGSTDDTSRILRTFAENHDGFPMTVINEAEKGTGAAADTGFRRAIHDGFDLVARTDADTVPRRDWSGRIVQDFAQYQQAQLLGGSSEPLRDSYYRRGDGLLLPFAIRAARRALAIEHWDGNYRHAVIGCNMATRATAYEEVGGFPRSSIDELDEDVAYSLKIAQEFGRSAIMIDPGLVVATSMRRIRHYGVAGTALHHLFPSVRTRVHKTIDIR